MVRSTARTDDPSASTTPTTAPPRRWPLPPASLPIQQLLPVRRRRNSHHRQHGASTSPDHHRFAITGSAGSMMDSRMLDQRNQQHLAGALKRPPKLCDVKMLFRLLALMTSTSWLMIA